MKRPIHIRAAWFLCAALAVYAALGLFARMESDDFCQTNDVKTYGIIGATLHVYETWNGRYSHMALTGIFYTLFGSRAPAVVPALMILGLTVSFWWALRCYVRDALLVAAMLIYGLLAFLPNFEQVLYWMPGSITYLAPLITGAGLVGLFARSRHDRFPEATPNRRPVQPPILMALAMVALVVTLGWALGRFPAFQQYAQAWDAGENPPQLAQWAYLDSPAVQLAAGCRAAFSGVDETS